MAKYTGGCGCGAVRFMVDEEPVSVVACHCNACKKRTGAAYGLSVLFNAAAVKEFKGATHKYERKGDSGATVHYDFCPTCGSTLRWRVDVIPGRTMLAAGAFDDLATLDFKPVAEMYTNLATSWTKLGCGLSAPMAPDDPFRKQMIQLRRKSP